MYYTTGISKTDPFTNLKETKINYLKGYDDVILDPKNPVTPSEPQKTELTYYGRFIQNSHTSVGRLPFLLAMILFIPLGVVAFLINSGVQSLRSTRRIRLHEKGLAGIQPGNYRVPLLIAGMREAAEDLYENVNSAQSNEYLVHGTEEEEAHAEPSSPVAARPSSLIASNKASEKAEVRQNDVPTLALAPYQFRMVQALDNVGFRKFPVYIHKVYHSHAAIIVRSDKPDFDEGRVVLRHWVDEEFLL